MFQKLFKDRPKIFDRLRVLGGGPSASRGGIRMPDGSPVSVEVIMQTHGVDRERAVELVRRQTR